MTNEIMPLGLSDLQEPQEKRPEDHLAGAIGLPPEQGASALRASRANDVPPVVARSGGLPEVRPLNLADLDAMPGVARALTSPEAAAAVKDDGEGLSRTQRAANSWKRGVIGVSQMPTAINIGATAQLYANMQEAARLADEGASEAMIRTRTGVMGWEFARKPVDERRRQLLALQMQTEPQVAEGAAMLAEGERRKAQFPAGQQVQEFMAQEGFTGSLAYLFRNPSLLLDVLPESAAQSVPSMALAPAGPVGVGAGSGVTGYAQGLLQGLQKAGVDTTSKEAIAAALNDPAKRREILQGAAGYGAGIGMADLATAWLAEFVRPFGLAASSLRSRAPIRVETAADKAANAAVRVGVEGAGGAAGEVLASGGEATAQDVLLEFLGEAAVSGPMEAAGLQIGAMQEARAKAEEAKAVADYMDRVAKVAAATKIAGRDPKTLGDIVENMAADAGAPTTLYVTSEDLADALHQAKVSLNDFAAMMPEHSTAIIEGFLEGTAVPLPVSSLMQVAAQNPVLNEALTQRVRPTEDGMSAKDATEFLQSTYNERVIAEADKILSGVSERSPMRASSEALRKRVEADLIKAGQSPEAAAKQSRLTAAFFTTAASDMQDVQPGITPEEVFRKWYPDGVAMVSGPGAQAAGQEMSQFDVDAGGTTAYTDPTIVVDGVERPTTNSNGKPIARTKEGLENFWRWFGDSKVVDADGKPLVVYHGTDVDITKFDKDKVRGRFPYSIGFHFTNRTGEASTYADGTENAAAGFDPASKFSKPPVEGGNVLPVYVLASNPLVIETDKSSASMEADMNRSEIIAQLVEAKRAGNPYDSVIIRRVRGDEYDGINVIVFEPAQIKSVFNRGTFSPTDPNILKQTAGLPETEVVLGQHPFAGFTREQFLGNPKITRDSNASDLKPRALSFLQDVSEETFAVGNGLTAKYSPDGAAVFEGDKVVASYNFGDTLVVDKAYRRQGIAEELVYQWRMRNPQSPPAKQRTKSSQALQEKVWERIEREIRSSDGRDVLFQAAYHGSPYRFSKFSLEHMGKGEGVQAYGWGLYFAGKREAGEFYRRGLSDANMQAPDGSIVPVGTEYQWIVKLLDEHGGDYGKAKAAMVEHGKTYKWPAEVATRKLNEWESGGFTLPPRGQLYRVEIPDDDQYLLWDKPVPEDVVRKIAEHSVERGLIEDADEAFDMLTDEFDVSGANMYHGLSEQLGGDEAASKFLNEIGIAGIKYLDGTSRGTGDGSYNYVIFDDNAVQIAETYYQRQEEVRGAYSMRTNLLRLTKANNASTFLHESGHQFLDLTVRMALMPNASPAIVKRADAILKWLGIEAEHGKTRAEVYLDMDIETLRPMHEKFAESFEAYLFKGQAPSLDLAEAFRAFKTWLKSVYRNLQSFLRNYPDAKIDTEITALMDRMLATDEQIAEAKASRAVIPLFDAKPESMTVEQWQAYLDDMRTLNEEAAEHIDEKRLADMQYLRRSAGKVLKQMQKDAAEKRAAARMEATRQVLSQPVYRLRQLLEAKPEPLPRKVEAKGLDTGVDSLAVAIAKLGGLNRDEAVAEWGIDPADFKELGKFRKPVLRAKGGMSPGHLTEVLAEYGYLPTDKDGKADMNLLADRLDAEARGDKQYSWQADWSRIFAEDFAPIPDIEQNPFAGARLDRYWLESKYAGDERMQVLLPLLWPMATKTTGTGVNPDDLAPLFGYGSGDEMVRALVESRPTQEAIDSLTDRLMIERHGDIESQEALARLVDEAIMSRHRSRVLATELSIINARVGKPSVILKAAREAAGNIIDSVKVGALRPDKYKMAAARAGRDSMNAYARGNADVAATAKQAQVLNVQLFNDATREKQAIADFLKETRKWFGDDEKIAKSRNMDMVILARSILGRYGMTSEGRAEDAVAARARLAQYNPQIAADLTDIEAGLPQGTDYTEMTVADVRAIRTVAEAVWNMARSDKTMTINGRKVQQEELAGEFIAALGSPVVADAAIGTKTTLEKLQDWTVGAWAHLRRVQAWADQFGDVVKDILTRPINDAISAHRGYVVGKTRAYRDAIERIRDRLDSTPIVAPELGRDKNGKPVTFAGGKLELLHAMLHTGNISNRDKLLMGRGWTDSKAGDDVISTARWYAFMARMYRDGVITKAEWDFCQEVWDILESMKPDAQKAHHAMFGYHFDEVTAVAVDTPFGTYRGGYVPAIADRSDPKAARQAEADDLLHAGNSFMFPTTGKGFTKRRVENYYKPLELDLRTITTHIDKVSRFIHIEPVVRDTVSFLKRDDVSTAIETSFPGFLNYGLNPWLQRVATQTATQGANPKAAKVIQFLSQRTGLQYIALSVLNAIQGSTGLMFAAVRSDINKGAIARATANYYRQRTSSLQKIKTLSPFMANRLDNQQQEMRGHVERLLIGDNLYTRMNQFIVEHGYFMQNIVQQQVDAIVWLAAYDSAESRGSDNAVAEADEAVRLTQQTTAPEDIAAYEAGGTLWTLLVKFSSYFNMMLNAMTTEQQKALGIDGTKDKAKRLAYIYSVFFVTNVVAQAMVKGAPDDEDDKDKDGMLDEWLWWLLSANTSVMSAMLPGVGQGMSYIAARADDNPVNDRLTVSPTLAYLEKTGGGLVAAAVVPFREEPATKKEVGEMLTLLSFATGIPTGQLNKAIGYTMDVEAGRQSPDGAGDYLTGLLSGKQW